VAREAARIIKLPTTSGNVGGGLATNGDQIYVSGLSGLETGGFAVTVALRAGGSAGPLLGGLVLAANGLSQTVWNHPLLVNSPLYFQVVSGTGTIDGTVHVL
jgi:hypothetical protein